MLFLIGAWLIRVNGIVEPEKGSVKLANIDIFVIPHVGDSCRKGHRARGIGDFLTREVHPTHGFEDVKLIMAIVEDLRFGRRSKCRTR